MAGVYLAVTAGAFLPACSVVRLDSVLGASGIDGLVLNAVNGNQSSAGACRSLVRYVEMR